MIADLNTRIVKCAIRRALKRAAPSTIPLSNMDRLRQRNYYSVSLIDKSESVKFLVKNLKDEGIEGYWFTGIGGEGGQESAISNKHIKSFSIEITHYAQELEIKHRSAIDFFWCTLTLKALREIWMHRIQVWTLSKKKLPREDRLEILTWAYKWTLTNDSQNSAFSAHNFLINKHGHLISHHPEVRKQLRYYNFVLESLAESGDVTRSRVGHFYLAPKALATLDQYEEADRRHQDNLSQHRRLSWLTFALVLVGVGQMVAGFFNN